MGLELFSASPRAAQMARARLRLALGAFGSSYSSPLATVHLSPTPLWKVALARGRERLAHIFTLCQVFCFNTLTSVSHFSHIQMYGAARCFHVSFQSQEAFFRRRRPKTCDNNTLSATTHSQMCRHSAQLQFFRTQKVKYEFSSSFSEPDVLPKSLFSDSDFQWSSFVGRHPHKLIR